MKKAVIENGVVENIIEADAKFRMPGKTLVTVTKRKGVEIGGTWDGSKFGPAPVAPVEPTSEPAAYRAIRALANEISPKARAAIEAIIGATP